MNHTMVVYNLIYVGLVVVALAVFAAVFLSTRASARERPLDLHAWKRRENIWLGVVIVALAVATAATILETPWRAQADANRQVVTVDAAQFGFTFSQPSVHVDRQVEFQLRSKDVNHGFALYDPDGTLVTQVQIMPGYTNTLRVTLHRTGTYTVVCIEYCGVGHHVMVAKYTVTV